MIRNLLFHAATSIYQNQRDKGVQNLSIEYQNNPDAFINEIFNLICSQNKTEHILAYSYLKKLIKDGQNCRLITMNEKMQKSFIFWYKQNESRNTMEQIYSFQKQNIVEIYSLYLSLNSSKRIRQQFIDEVPFKICELTTKGNKLQLFMYLSLYGEVLKQLDKYRIGNISSRKAAMGNVMLLKVTTRLNPQNSFQASLWLDFTINFSKFNSWMPDKNFLINCLTKYLISRDSLMSLLQYLSINFQAVWILQDQCRILHGLTQKIQICESKISEYTCKQVETILKCLKSFLHNFFVSDRIVSNIGEAKIVDFIYSYEQFQRISNFIIKAVEFFSSNNEKQSMGNLSQMIVEYSTQILRLYSNYLKGQEIQAYSKRFIQSFGNQPQYEKIFVFFSSLPKPILQCFGYDQAVIQIVQGKINLSENYEPIYINFLSHCIDINYSLQDDVVEKIASFFFNLIQSRSKQLQQIQKNSSQCFTNGRYNLNVERISLSLHGISKLGKFKTFVNKNAQYFNIISDKIFELLFKCTNQFSILVEAIDEFVKHGSREWNQKICMKAMSYLMRIYDRHLKDQKTIYFQIQAELYRIMKKTVCLEQTFKQILNLTVIENSFYKTQVSQWIQLKFMVYVCILNEKSQFVKEEILLFLQEVLIQFNITFCSQTFKLIQPLLLNFFDSLVTKSVFDSIKHFLSLTLQRNTQVIIQNNLFEKLQINQQQYAITGSVESKQVHLTCVKILLELILHDKLLQDIYFTIQNNNSRYMFCIWEALQIIYPGKLKPNLFPPIVNQRLQKIRTGNLLSLLQNMGINQQNQAKTKQMPSWYQLYRNILREDSVLIQVVNKSLANL